MSNTSREATDPFVQELTARAEHDRSVGELKTAAIFEAAAKAAADAFTFDEFFHACPRFSTTDVFPVEIGVALLTLAAQSVARMVEVQEGAPICALVSGDAVVQSVDYATVSSETAPNELVQSLLDPSSDLTFLVQRDGNTRLIQWQDVQWSVSDGTYDLGSAMRAQPKSTQQLGSALSNHIDPLVQYFVGRADDKRTLVNDFAAERRFLLAAEAAAGPDAIENFHLSVAREGLGRDHRIDRRLAAQVVAKTVDVEAETPALVSISNTGTIRNVRRMKPADIADAIAEAEASAAPADTWLYAVYRVGTERSIYWSDWDSNEWIVPDGTYDVTADPSLEAMAVVADAEADDVAKQSARTVTRGRGGTRPGPLDVPMF